MTASERNKDFNYQRYLASREWALLREQVRDRSSNHCEHCCIAQQEAVHHLTYERVGREFLTDLMAVCNPCHDFLCGLVGRNPLNEWAVVTPAFIPDSGDQPRHFLLPFNVPEGLTAIAVRKAICQGDGCLWCKYKDNWWPYFVINLELRR